MPSFFRALNYVAFVLVLGVTAACSTPAEIPSTTTKVTTQPIEKTAAPLVAATSGITPQPRVAPTLTPTLFVTETPLSSPTPTITLTPNLVYNEPGFYGNVGGCVMYELDRGDISVDFCVESIEVVRDRSMYVSVSWVVHNRGGWYTITKRSDARNLSMYITDNLGNRYNHNGAGGDAATELKIKDGDTSFFGWFHFPPVFPDAKVLTFHDGNQNVQISDLILTNPKILRGNFVLDHYPFTLEYLLDKWKAETTMDGKKTLTHLKMPQCQIIEWFPAEPQGKFKNTISIGVIDYTIYGTTDSKNKISIREYLAVKGVEFSDSTQQPFLRVTVPFDNGTQCLTDVGTVLSTLYSSTEK